MVQCSVLVFLYTVYIIAYSSFWCFVSVYILLVILLTRADIFQDIRAFRIVIVRHFLSRYKKDAYYLTPDSGKLTRNYVRSVRTRVANFCKVSRDITIKEMRGALVETAGAVPFRHIPNEKEVEIYTTF